ncbi:MAG: DNA polymerase/3'-5' exonuclease PolX [Pirellulales bacterium]
MQNREIAAALDEIADLLEFQDANPFRVRAYRNAARRVADHPRSLAAIVAEGGSLTQIDGIGKDLAEKIATLIATGKLPMLAELQAEVPSSVLTLLRIPGLGPKKAAALFKQLNIQSLDMLRVACDEHRVRDLKGFGAKTEVLILAGIDLAAQAGKRIYWADADAIVQELRAHLQCTPGLEQLEVAGSYRRGKETVGDLDLLVDAAAHGPVMDRLAEYPGVKDTIARGDTKMSVRLDSGLQVDLRVVPKQSFGAALQYFTGSKDHNVILRGMAKDRGLKINEWGVYHVDNEGNEQGPSIAGCTEEEVYRSMDLPCFPPEIREARDEFPWAAAGKLPHLIELGDIAGDLHMHTSATDGKNTIREMATAAQALELNYIAITDHSKRVTMARGLNAQRAREQWAEIERVNGELAGFRVLKGIECDILESGAMDLPDDVLAEADWVVASLHYGQNQPRKQIMERLLGAIAHPSVHVIAHPTGRLIGRRDPYELDVDELIAAAANHGKMLELNCNPARLDLNDIHCAAAKRHGVPIVMSTDAHSIGGLNTMRYGILQARRAGLTKADVANTRPWAKFAKLLRPK